MRSGCSVGEGPSLVRFRTHPLGGLRREEAVPQPLDKRPVGPGGPRPIFALCQEDPYTRRAFEKPRGYAGDAVMLDFFRPRAVEGSQGR